MTQAVGFSRALKMPHRGIFARRDAKRRARAVRIPPCNPLQSLLQKQKSSAPQGAALGADGGIRTHVALLPN